jgi:hypothetical protein
MLRDPPREEAARHARTRPVGRVAAAATSAGPARARGLREDTLHPTGRAWAEDREPRWRPSPPGAHHIVNVASCIRNAMSPSTRIFPVMKASCPFILPACTAR